MKKAKRLKIMATGLALSMIGCTIIKNSSFSCLHDYKDNAILTFDEVEPNSVFFHKTIHDRITLQDVILTMEERGIQENNSLEYQYIIKDIENDSFAVQQLHIEENLSSAFLAPAITNMITKHKNHQLYDIEHNDIYWDKVLPIWIKNSEEQVALDKQYQEFTHSQKLYLGLSVLEENKLEALVHQMQEFIIVIKKQIPALDMKRIACQLEEMSFCYTNHNYPDALLVSDQFTLLFPNTFGISLNIDMMKKDLFHEFKHMIATPCDDEVKNQMFFPSQTGIYTIPSISDLSKKEQRNSYTWYYLPFDWLFLEEAGAETFGSELSKQKPTTYQAERQLEQDLLFSLSLMPNFDKHIFIKCSLLHNPIALLQQFPIPSSNDNWIYQNAKMIESYNILSNQQAFLNYILNIEEIEGYQDTFKRQNGQFSFDAQNILLSLEDTADLQLRRIFLINMMNYDKSCTLEDYIYLYQLMDQRIENHRLTMKAYYGITINDSFYQTKKEEYQQLYIKYLNTKFCLEDILRYINTSLENNHLSSTFTKEEKLYYNGLSKDDMANLSINRQSLDKVLSYYLGE